VQNRAKPFALSFNGIKIMVKWLGMASNVLGAFLVAFGIMLAGYTAFIIGSILWVCIGLGSKDKPLVIQSAIFLVANIIGMYHAII